MVAPPTKRPRASGVSGWYDTFPGQMMPFESLNAVQRRGPALMRAWTNLGESTVCVSFIEQARSYGWYQTVLLHHSGG